jgi:hypothetical protein
MERIAWNERVPAGFTQKPDERRHSGINSAAALLIGVGVGVGVGMLLAPASGRETRNQISNRVQELGGRVRGKFASEKHEPGTGTYGG